MTPKQLLDAGKVQDAIAALTSYLRDHPTDATQRTFLFELLCFAGQYERAQRQLAALSEGGTQKEMGAVLYYSALHAEKLRHEVFQKEEYPRVSAAASPSGTLNGKPFKSISDADPVIGARLEVHAAGAYLWIPFEHITYIEIQPPTKLRDTLWAPALVRTGPAFKGTEMGEVLLPVIYPFSWKNSDEAVWLGRATAWAADDNGHEFPVGQKILMVDGEEVPMLEVRTVEFSTAESASQAVSH